MPNILIWTWLQVLTKLISEISLAGKMLLKFNVYPRFAISRQLSNLLELSSWTLYLLVSPADNLCKQLRPMGMIWIQTACHSTGITRKCFRKKQQQQKQKNNFEKKIRRRQKHGNLPRWQKEWMEWTGRCYMYMKVSCLGLIFACFQYGTV